MIGARGVITEGGIVVRADHRGYTPEQIADHESYHGMKDIYGQKLNDDLVARIREEFSREELDAVLDQYLVALQGVYDQDTESEQSRVQAVMEELLADAHAGINAFDAGATKFSDTVNRFLAENHLTREMTQENGVRETAGPPSIQKENTAGYDGEQYSIDERFESLIDSWDGKTIGFSFVVGDTSDALQEAGIPKKQIRWDASKIKTLLAKHNGMSVETVKQIPALLEHPIVIIDSKKGTNSKIVMGDLYDEHGKIVTAVLLLTPTSKKGNVLDILKISSAEGRSHIKSLFTSEDGKPVPVRYIDKKRIQSWLNVNRLQLPLHNLDLDSNKIIDYAGASVKEKSADDEYMSDEEFQEQYRLKLPSLDQTEKEPDSQTFGAEKGRQEYRESYSVDDTRDLSEEEINAVRIFGITKSFEEAGYILPDGQLLSLTNENHHGERIYDHRAIAMAYGADVDLNVNHGFSFDNGHYMDEFVEAGNIRFDAGDPDLNMDIGLQLSSSVPLTKAQERTIRDLVEWKENREEIFESNMTEDNFLYSGPLAIRLDFGGDSKYAVGSSSIKDLTAWGKKALEYKGKRISAGQIIHDVRHYYETGETLQRSNLSQFRYSVDDESEVAEEQAQEAEQNTSDVTKEEKSPVSRLRQRRKLLIGRKPVLFLYASNFVAILSPK